MLIFKNKIERENEQKDTYVATIVHDLKTPLIAQSRMLESFIKKTSDLTLKNHYSQMLLSLRIMLEMIISITNTYKYNNGKIKYNFQNVNIVELTENVCTELTYLTSEQNIINLIIKSEKPVIIADRLHLRRVISNLLANAIRYHKDNTQITIELSTDKKNFKFKITNYGTYIKPEIQKELFKKYVSPTAKFNSSATGLGLYLSKEIINAHSGKMFLISTKEGINTFGFIMPKELNKLPIEFLKKLVMDKAL